MIKKQKKPKKPKKEMSGDDKIWKRMNQQVLGMLIFTVLPFLIIAMDFGIRYPKTGTTAQLLTVAREWQGLVAGTFALLAAAFTARAVVMQISSAESLEQTRLEEARALDERNTARDLLAARSVMPLTLSVLADYATSVAVSAHKVLNQMPKGGSLSRRLMTMPEMPSAPASIIADLQNFIRVAPTDLGTSVADILADLQLLRTNAEDSWLKSLIFRPKWEGLIGRAAVLYARIDALYPYARRQVETAPSLPEEYNVDIVLALWFDGMEDFPGYTKAAHACLKRATSPEA